jgi:hypothetical protein
MQSGLYDLNMVTWGDFGATTYTYEATSFDEMRIDLVSREVFGNDENVDFLLNYNNIDNPLNIMDGDTIYYTSVQDAYRGAYVDVQDSAIASSLILSRRSTRIDPNRTEYINNDKSLTPTMKSSPGSTVNVVGNKIIIG